MKSKTQTPSQTRALGRALGRRARPGDVILLLGDLGAGKTTLTQGIAAGAGFRGRVTSPTFGLAREYRAPKITVHHLDLYRVAESETGDIGLEEYLFDPRAFCVIEWPAAAAAYLPEDRLEVRLSRARSGRAFSFRSAGPAAGRLLKELRASVR